MIRLNFKTNLKDTIINSYLKIVSKFFPYADFKTRADSKYLWRQLYPNQDEKIEQFLSILDDAFSVPKKYHFRIKPEDRVEELYKRSAVFIDSFEIEMVVDGVSKQFGYELSEEGVSCDSTFGEIFLEIIRNDSIP
jgi:hypothetical protein